MALQFPWEMFSIAQQEANKNQQRTYQNIADLGQNLGQGMQNYADQVRAQKQKQVMAQLIAAMNGQGMPQQGPPMFQNGPTGGASPLPPVGGNAQMGPTQPMKPISGMGAPAQDNSNLIQSLMMQLNPEAGIKAQFERMDPYKQALTTQANAEAEKALRPPVPKIPLEYIDTGRTTLDGKAIYVNKATGEEIIGKTSGTPKPAMGSANADERHRQFSMTQLPSNQGISTAGGAAYQVKVGARQGMNLIAKPGSPQRTGAAAADLVRSITRVAPTDEGLRYANFSDNLVTRWGLLKQKLDADPKMIYNGAIRKEMYNIFKEMDESATPFIQNQLDDLAAGGYDIPEATRKRQLGLTLPKIEFKGDPDQGSSNPTNSQVVNFSVTP